MNLRHILAATVLMPAAVLAQNDTLSHQLDNVVVTGTRNAVSIRHLPTTVSVVDRVALTAAYRPSMLPTLSEEVPGLFVTSRGIMGYGVSDGAAGGISVRGMSSSQGRFLVLIDGQPQYMGLFGHAIADACQTMLAERVEVLRGPASVLYGSNAMGGVMNIITRKMPANGMSTEINIGAGSYGTLQSGLSNRIRAGRFASALALRYDRTDGHRPHMGFEQYGGYLKLDYRLAAHWQATADANITHFNASYAGAVQSPLLDARQWITRGALSAHVENRYAATSGAVSLYYNFGRHKINDGHAPSAAPRTQYFRSNDLMMGLSVYQTTSLFVGNWLTIGGDYRRYGGKAWNQDIATGADGTPIIDRTQNDFAGYIDLRQPLWAWLTLDAGLRIDHLEHVGTEFVPQGGVAIHLPCGTEIKAIVSKGYRNPTLRELYMWRPANAELQTERAMNYEISYRQRLPESNLSYGLSLFVLRGSNIIQTVMGPSGPQNINTGRISNRGLEADISYQPSAAWHFTANYSALHMANHLIAAPEHKLFGGAKYTGHRWKIDTGVQYVAGLFTQLAPSEVRESFVLWNLTATYQLQKHVDVWFKGENLLAQRYEINHGYPMPKTTFMAGVNVNL